MFQPGFGRKSFHREPPDAPHPHSHHQYSHVIAGEKNILKLSLALPSHSHVDVPI